MKTMESKQKWAEREYNIQEDNDLTPEGVKIFCDTTQFPLFPFCGSDTIPHAVRGLIRHHDIRLYSKL